MFLVPTPEANTHDQPPEFSFLPEASALPTRLLPREGC